MQDNQLSIPTPKDPVQLSIHPEETLRDLKERIISQGHSSVGFQSLDGSRISQSTLFKEITGLSYLIKIDDFVVKVVSHGEKSSKNYTVYKFDDLINELDIDASKQGIIKKYLLRISNTIQLKTQISKVELSHLMTEMIPRQEKSKQTQREIAQTLESYQNELNKFANVEKFVEKRARIYANSIFTVGLGVLALQWAYIGTGTFIFYSWDIMEPQAYLIGLGNFIFGLGYYTLRKKCFRMDSIYNILMENRKQVLYRRYFVDRERLDFLKLEVNRLKAHLLGNIR